jgi:hypothetical protein
MNSGLEEEPSAVFTSVDLSDLAEVEQFSVLEATAATLQSSLSLSEGPPMRVAYFDFGAAKPGRLLMIIHHLVVDGISWRVLVEDLETAYHQLENGRAVQFPSKTTSYRAAATRLKQYVEQGAFDGELTYWLDRRSQTAAKAEGISELPKDFSHGRNTEASAKVVSVSLSADETRALLQDVPKAYNTQVNDVLLTALVQAFSYWTGDAGLLIDLEGHGRVETLEDIDLSRTGRLLHRTVSSSAPSRTRHAVGRCVEIDQGAVEADSEPRRRLWPDAIPLDQGGRPAETRVAA